MTIEEVFSEISKHMIKGLMVHTQLADYFEFLGLCGYHKCHEYHYFEESKNFRELCSYYMKHVGKFITDSHIANPNIIPENWFKYNRSQVDASTRKAGVQAGFDKWIEWEKETKVLYQTMYQALVDIGEGAAAMVIQCYLEDVDEELASAQQKQLELKAIDYNISDIISEQACLYKKYIKKIEKIY